MFHRYFLAPTALMLTCALTLRAQQGSAALAGSPSATIAVADALYASGNATAAEREYRAVLAREPSNSRALYRLAMLRRQHAHEAVSLLERYVALEPGDAWGRIALGDARARAGDVTGGLAAYATAERLAPGERDVHVGRARMLAGVGRTDDAIGVYERWCAQSPRDAEALRELAVQQRRAGRLRSSMRSYELAQRTSTDAHAERQLSTLRYATAPRLAPVVGSSRDSDGNTLWRLGASAGLSIADAADLTIGGGMQRTSDASDNVTVRRASVDLAWRPRASTRVEISAGASFSPSDTALVAAVPLPGAPGGGPGSGPGGPPIVAGRPPSPGASTHTVPSARVRYVWRDPAGRAALDLRGTHALLDASPFLVRNDVERTEIGGEGQLRLVGPLAVRALARGASVHSALDANSRMTLGGRVVLSTPFLGQLSGGLQQLTYAHASSAGYFAPKWARTAEIGVYREIEFDGGATFAFDAGAGAQRAAEWDAAPGNWSPAYRGWAALGVPLAPGRELRVEVESYDAKLGSEIATASSRWRYGSASVSLRWSLR